MSTDETILLETLFWLNFGVAWAGIWLGIGLAIAATCHAILVAGQALYCFIKRKVREHERIVNEKILRGIK